MGKHAFAAAVALALTAASTQVVSKIDEAGGLDRLRDGAGHHGWTQDLRDGPVLAGRKPGVSPGIGV